jgi:hypothetical protein
VRVSKNPPIVPPDLSKEKTKLPQRSPHPLDILLQEAEKLKRPVTLNDVKKLLTEKQFKKILLHAANDKKLSLLLKIHFARSYISELPHVKQSSEAYNLVTLRHRGVGVYFKNDPQLLHSFSLQFLKSLLRPHIVDQAELVASANSLLIREQLPIIQSIPLLIESPKRFMQQLSQEHNEIIQKRLKKEEFISTIIDCLLADQEKKKDLTDQDFARLPLVELLAYSEKKLRIGYEQTMATIEEFFGTWESAREEARKLYLAGLSNRDAQKNKTKKKK